LNAVRRARCDRRVMKRHAGRLPPSPSARRLQRSGGMRGCLVRAHARRPEALEE
jgi:hypothetical protein